MRLCETHSGFFFLEGFFWIRGLGGEEKKKRRKGKKEEDGGRRGGFSVCGDEKREKGN